MPSSVTWTTSIAPSAARIPQAIEAASKAGPAGAAVVKIVSPLDSTISQFVPTSINKRTRLSRSIPVASTPATMSPPTYAPKAGNKNTRALGKISMPTSAAVNTGHFCAAVMKGATPTGSGSTPSKISTIVALPAIAVS